MLALIALFLTIVGDSIFQIALGKFMHYIAGKEILVLAILVFLFLLLWLAGEFIEDKLNK